MLAVSSGGVEEGSGQLLWARFMTGGVIMRGWLDGWAGPMSSGDGDGAGWVGPMLSTDVAAKADPMSSGD